MTAETLLVRIVLAGVLLGHAAIHLGFVSPKPALAVGGPVWPFDVARGWLVTRVGLAPRPAHAAAATLVLGVLAAYGVGAISLVAGAVALAAWAVAAGSSLSLVLLLGFGRLTLLLGVVIDVVALGIIARVLGGATPAFL